MATEMSTPWTVVLTRTVTTFSAAAGRCRQRFWTDFGFKGRIESVVVLDATFEHTLQARDALVDAFESPIEEASQWP